MDKMIKSTYVIFLVSIFSTMKSSEGIDVHDIMPADYDYLRIPEHLNSSMEVNIRVEKLNIRSIDESAMTFSVTLEMWQQWVDERLIYPSWASKDFQVLESKWIYKLWNPKLYFVNSLDGKLDNIITPTSFFWLKPDKLISFFCRVILKLFCQMDLRDFPHDDQKCFIQMGSAIYTTKELSLSWRHTTNEIQLLTLHQFDVYGLEKSSFLKPMGATSNASCLQLSVHLRRRTGYYLINTYIPTILIVIMSMLTFWIPPDAVPARITLGVTSLLTIITKQYQEAMPRVSYVVAMNVWLSACIGFVFLTLLEYAIIITLSMNVKNVEENQQSPETNMVILRSNGTWTVKTDWTETVEKKKPRIYPKRLDYISRIIFPIAFLTFIFVYWTQYT